MKLNITIITSILILISSIILLYKLSNIKYDLHEYKVLKKHGQMKSEYKSSEVYTDFILILETINKDIISINVDPATFYSAEVNNKLKFRLSHKVSKIEPTSNLLLYKNTIMLLLVIILFITALVATFSSASKLTTLILKQ